MELQDIFRIVVTLAGFICFVAICVWAYGKRSREGFDEAANAPILDDDTPHTPKQSS
ncbi:cbb3-type cytochrome oxidase subunit 3 [Andreprevotia chitinilytica]|uniref:cbb3-type cytochrome oxidase subunit 3 n=1 Tax=Andreprevotia chitinilytica TaxID=396808 RepID=UPI000554AF74|nr:cbb3-type cytochrome c oxidase subunit 3 [Andreprevotia chitinilytica]